MVGLRRGTVKLVPHTEEWTSFFEKERALLKEQLGSLALDIQHVGSTAIPDMPAKPIIDIAVCTKTTKNFSKFINPLRELDYEFRENASNWRGFFFAKGPEEKRTCHIHLVKYNGEIWKDYLALRDYLKADKKHAREYALLKEKLAKKFSEKRPKYTAGKSKFIRATINTARSITV